MNHDEHFYGENLIDTARRERSEVFAEFGQKVFRAPGKLLRNGLDDIRRYRRPIKTV